MPDSACFVAFGRARVGAAGLRARSSGVPSAPGAASLTPRRPPRRPRAPAARLGAASTTAQASTRGGAASACAAAPVDAWHAAAAEGDVLAMVALVRGGFLDVGARADYGARPSALHVGSALGREDVVACLFELARGVGGGREDFGHRDASEMMGAVDDVGRNALHYAATADEREIEGKFIAATVRRLVDLGVSPLTLDVDGHTPAKLARMLGHVAAEMELTRACRRVGG